MNRPAGGQAVPAKVDAFWSTGDAPPMRYVTFHVRDAELIVQAPLVSPYWALLAPLLFPLVAILFHLVAGAIMVVVMVAGIVAMPKKVIARARTADIRACTLVSRRGPLKIFQRERVTLTFAGGGVWQLTNTERNDAGARRIVALLTDAGIAVLPA